MKIGDRVIGKKLGPLYPSNVIGIVSFEAATKLLGFDPFSGPDSYVDDDIYYVCKFDEPVPSVPKKIIAESLPVEYPFFEELEKNKEMKAKYVDHYYNHIAKKLQYIIYPASAVELLYE